MNRGEMEHNMNLLHIVRTNRNVLFQHTDTSESSLLPPPAPTLSSNGEEMRVRFKFYTNIDLHR